MRRTWRRLCFAAGLAAGLLVPDCGPAVATGTREAVFPLTVPPGQRYLIDAAGQPFLIHGDTAWSLIAELRREEVDLYLKDRRARGFNTLLVSLIEHHYASNPPANAYGDQPFLAPGDYGTPNERYFAHADWVLRRAAEEGFLVLLTPSYVGYGGGGEGWYQEMVTNGPAKLHGYGRYLGQRYRRFSNILWMQGGDWNPPDKDLIRAIARGIADADPRVLQSAHGSVETAALDHWHGEPWLKINTIYTYSDVFEAAMEQLRRNEVMPFFLVESLYENEHGVTERRPRMQAYQAILAGAAGHVFGNNPIWHFDGPGAFDAPVSWQEALASRGAESMTHLREFFRPLRWWMLRPDADGTFLTGGSIRHGRRSVAAVAADGSFAVAYLPTRRAITLDLARLSGPKLRLRWYDPAAGRFVGAASEIAPTARSFALRPPRADSAGFNDWVLLIGSEP